MAHQQKYYKDIEANGHLWRLEIWQDIPVNEENGEPTHILTPVEIGPVLQSLRLVVQGDQADVDTPIVKTSLEMSFVDAPGLEYERKCGYWEEFYTSSATEYQVKLYKDNILEWTGYVTPDSFAEDLRYRGSVNIIARDNLGTLQDTTFDMSQEQNVDGKVYLFELITKALNLSTCALDCDIFEYDAPKAVALMDPFSDRSGDLLYQLVDIAAFKEKDWWKALEATLYAVGLALRYVGGNKLVLIPLRDLPKQGAQYWWDVPVKDVQFLAYGRRELVPAVKSIKETIEYNIEQEEVKESIDDYVPNDSQNLSFASSIHSMSLQGPTSTWVNGYAPVHGYKKSRKNQYIMSESSPLLDVSAYTRLEGEDSEEYGEWADKGIIYFAVNAPERPVVFPKKVCSADDKITISLTATKPVTVTKDRKHVLNLPLSRAREYSTYAVIEYRLKYTNPSTGETKFYNGSWNSNDSANFIEISNEFFASDRPRPATFAFKDIPSPGVGLLEFEIIDIRMPVMAIDLRKDCEGVYLRIKDISIDVAIPEDNNVLDRVKLTTEYSDKYSVRITRSPELGINPTTDAHVAYVPNAILAEGKAQYVGAEQWVWPLGRETIPSTGISLSRLIHQQLLAYHAQPNNLLTGELMDAAGDTPDFRSLWRWNGKLHMLMSGTLNVLTGRMESATLREFVRYDHMWETWVENEDVVVDYRLTYISLWVHSNKQLGPDSWDETIPDWIFIASENYDQEKKAYEFRLATLENTTGQERVAQFKIDTADVRITQRAAGDYGIDYGEDYS